MSCAAPLRGFQDSETPTHQNDTPQPMLESPSRRREPALTRLGGRRNCGKKSGTEKVVAWPGLSSGLVRNQRLVSGNQPIAVGFPENEHSSTVDRRSRVGLAIICGDVTEVV